MNAIAIKTKQLPTGALFFIGWLLLMTLIPFLMILSMSFLQKGPLGNVVVIPTLANYLRCFQWLYVRVLGKTVWLALMATTSCLLIGFPVAYYLARAEGLMKKLGLILLFIPFWTNFILRIYGIVSLLGTHGLLNQALMRLGLIHEPLSIFIPVPAFISACSITTSLFSRCRFSPRLRNSTARYVRRRRILERVGSRHSGKSSFRM